MRKRYLLFALFFVSSFSLFTACNKDDNNNGGGTTPKTKTQLLTQNTWKAKSATVSGVNYPLQACILDNIFTFSSNGTGSVNESTNVCAGATAGTTPFTWTFQTSETQIQLSTPLFQGGLNTVTVESLTETDLIVTFPYSPGPGVNVTVRVVFQHS